MRRLVAASPRSQANVAFLGDKKFIVAPDASAFLMYGRLGRSWISMGDPIGDPAAAPDLIWRLRELADQAGGRAVYYAVGPANLPTYLDMGFSVLKIAEVARVDLAKFSLTGKKAHDFRYADRRAAEGGPELRDHPESGGCLPHRPAPRRLRCLARAQIRQRERLFARRVLARLSQRVRLRRDAR